MLLIKTEVKPSKIAGLGLFAQENIKKETLVWQYTPKTCVIWTKDQMQNLLESYHKTEDQIIHYLLTYTYYQERQGLILCLDNGRFVNHAEKPNLQTPTHMPKEEGWQYSVANRDIKAGEELTEDYRTYDSIAWLDELCKKYQIFHYS